MIDWPLSRVGHYILDDQRNVVEVEDVVEWARWMEESENCFVAKTKVGESRVSTVFIGLDHNFGQGGRRGEEDAAMTMREGQIDRQSAVW
jgi:hypothetical protein